MARKKNKPLLENIRVEKYASEGKCLSRHEGKVIFTPMTAPGDLVDIQLTKNKKDYAEGRVVKIHEKSEKRVDPFCQHFDLCGGCKWQHIPYEEQLWLKETQVKDALYKFLETHKPAFHPIVGSEDQTHYRNKMEYTFTNLRWLPREDLEKDREFIRDGIGLHIPGFHERVVDIYKCWLQDERGDDIRNALRDFSIENNFEFYNVKAHEGFVRNLMIRNSTLNQWMVLVQFGKENTEDIEKTMHFLSESFPFITSLLYVVNTKKNDTLYDQDVICYKGNEVIEEKLGEYTFTIGAKSFFQTNSKQAEKLYNKTLEFCQLKGTENVYDLYCGAGTISCYLAKNAKKVTGVESVQMAIDDAHKNAKKNNIVNTSFVCGDMKDVFTSDFLDAHGQPDVIVVDPPRAGLHPDVTQNLLHSGAGSIVYVSCNPATQARDIGVFAEKYRLAEVQPVDMFPHTHHVENIVRLELNK